MIKKKNIMEINSGQFIYLGRWVDKDTFRAFVYSKKGEEKLATSYKDFQDLISSGLWFAEKQDPVVDPKIRKQKDAVCPTS